MTMGSGTGIAFMIPRAPYKYRTSFSLSWLPSCGKPNCLGFLTLALCLKCTVIVAIMQCPKFCCKWALKQLILTFHPNSELGDVQLKALLVPQHLILAAPLWETQLMASNVHFGGLLRLLTLGFPIFQPTPEMPLFIAWNKVHCARYCVTKELFS